MGSGVNCTPTLSSTSAASPSLPSPVAWFLLHSFLFCLLLTLRFPHLLILPTPQLPDPFLKCQVARQDTGRPPALQPVRHVPIPRTLPHQGCVSTYRSRRPDSAVCPDGALTLGGSREPANVLTPRQPVPWLMPVPNYAYGSVVTVEMPGTGCYPRLKTIWLCPLASSEESTLGCLGS